MKVAAILLILALPVAIGAAPPAPPPPPSPAEVQAFAPVKAAHQALAARSDGFWLKPDPAAPAALERWWAQVRSWVEARLDRAGATGLDAEAHRLDPDLAIQLLALGDGVTLVAADDGSFGTAFVAGRRDGRYRTLWALSALAPPAVARFPLLGAWSSAQTRFSCNPEKRACGPLTAGRLLLLPAQADGAARFAVDSTYTSPAGATVGGQLSIWRWNGAGLRAGAEPLLVRDYGYMVDTAEAGARLTGDILTLRFKGYYARMFACGACEGRQRVTRLRIGPARIDDLGTTSLVPELDFIDTLFDRLFRRRSIGGLATAGAAAALRRQVAEARAEGGDGGDVGLGMVTSWKLEAHGSERRLCLSLGDGGHLYTIARGARGMRLLAARSVDDSLCSGNGSHS